MSCHIARRIPLLPHYSGLLPRVARRTRSTSDRANCCTAAKAWWPHWSRSAFGRKKVVMNNPWTKKNPLMSMWLSAANKAMGSARGHATGAAKRQVAATQAEAVKQIVDFWSGKPTRPPARKKTRR